MIKNSHNSVNTLLLVKLICLNYRIAEWDKFAVFEDWHISAKIWDSKIKPKNIG